MRFDKGMGKKRRGRFKFWKEDYIRIKKIKDRRKYKGKRKDMDS